MVIRLFDILDGKVVPTEHCHTLKTLSAVMESHPDDYLKVYQYVFYMTCPNPELNPFFNTPENSKEDLILKEVDAQFSTEDDTIIAALAFCTQLYSTPTYRAYMGIKKMVDKLSDYMNNEEIVDGRDGNGSFILRAMKDFKEIRESYKATYQDLINEQGNRARGGQDLGYDQK